MEGRPVQFTDEWCCGCVLPPPPPPPSTPRSARYAAKTQLGVLTRPLAGLAERHFHSRGGSHVRRYKRSSLEYRLEVKRSQRIPAKSHSSPAGLGILLSSAKARRCEPQRSALGSVFGLIIPTHLSQDLQP